MFTRIVKRGDKSYLYQEERWREGGKVKSRSRSLGPVGGRRSLAQFISDQRDDSGGVDWFKIEEELLAKQKAVEPVSVSPTPSSPPATAEPVSAPEQHSAPAPDAPEGSSSEQSPSHPSS